jgi:ADP-heptose:LPS heptosyltransferase
VEIIKRKPTFVVIRQLGGVGDVLALSCLYRGIKEQFPGHHVINVTTDIYFAGALVDLARHNPYIDEIVKISPFEAASSITKKVWHSYMGAPDIMDEMVIRTADKAVDLNVACVERESAEWETYKTIITPRYKIWCDAAGIVPSSYAPIYVIKEKEQALADEWWMANFKGDTPTPFLRDRTRTGQQIVGLGLASANPSADARTMDIDKLTEIAHQLQAQGVYVVTVDPTRKIDGVPYIVGKRLQDLMPILRRMSAVITVDTGLLHCAGVVNTPVIGLFGSTDYRMRMAYYRGSAIDSKALVPCAYCWYTHKCLAPNMPKSGHMKCMKLIEPSMVVAETLRWCDYVKRESSGIQLPMIQ